MDKQDHSGVGPGASIEAKAAREDEAMKLGEMTAMAALGATTIGVCASDLTHASERASGSSSPENSAALIPPYSLPPSRTKPPMAEGYSPARIVASPGVAPPPPPGMVLYGAFPEVLTEKQAAKKTVDLSRSTLDIGTGGWSEYWYGHRFELAGKHYFVGFVATADYCGKQCESQFLVRSKQALVGASTFIESPHGDDQMMIYDVPWKLVEGDAVIGKFGNFEKGSIVLNISPETHWTNEGHYLLAVPTEHMLGDGFNNNESEIFELDPYFLIHGELKTWDGFVWRHVGTIVTGENNDGQCSPDIRHSADYPPCWGSTGDMRFVQVPGSDLPLIEVRRKGSELDGFSRIRAVDTSVITTWRFDDANKRYMEIKPR